MRALIHRIVRCRTGAIAIEMAAVAPMLALCVLALADFGLAANERMKLASAARAGAQAALSDATNTTRITQSVQTATDVDSSRLTIGITTACGCSDGTAITCGSTCTGGTTTRNYVTVSVSETYPMILTYPGVGSSLKLSTSATLRY